MLKRVYAYGVFLAFFWGAAFLMAWLAPDWFGSMSMPFFVCAMFSAIPLRDVFKTKLLGAFVAIPALALFWAISGYFAVQFSLADGHSGAGFANLTVGFALILDYLVSLFVANSLFSVSLGMFESQESNSAASKAQS